MPAVPAGGGLKTEEGEGGRARLVCVCLCVRRCQRPPADFPLWLLSRRPVVVGGGGGLVDDMSKVSLRATRRTKTQQGEFSIVIVI